MQAWTFQQVVIYVLIFLILIFELAQNNNLTAKFCFPVSLSMTFRRALWLHQPPFLWHSDEHYGCTNLPFYDIQTSTMAAPTSLSMTFRRALWLHQPPFLWHSDEHYGCTNLPFYDIQTSTMAAPTSLSMTFRRALWLHQPPFLWHSDEHYGCTNLPFYDIQTSTMAAPTSLSMTFRRALWLHQPPFLWHSDEHYGCTNLSACSFAMSFFILSILDCSLRRRWLGGRSLKSSFWLSLCWKKFTQPIKIEQWKSGTYTNLIQFCLTSL